MCCQVGGYLISNRVALGELLVPAALESAPLQPAVLLLGAAVAVAGAVGAAVAAALTPLVIRDW
jgi:hypothetical protein